MQRRQFIWISSLSCLAIVLPVSSCSEYKSELVKVLVLPFSLSKILNTENIKKVGKHYIRNIKEDNIDKETLKWELLSNIENIKNSEIETNVIDVAHQLIEKIKNDFKFNRITQLDGWILSQTEAQQCALLYLLD